MDKVGLADTILEQFFMFGGFIVLIPLIFYPLYPGSTCFDKNGYRHPCKGKGLHVAVMISLILVCIAGFFITMRVNGI